MALLNALLDVDSLLEFEISLVELPELDTAFLHSEELNLISKVHLSRLPESTMSCNLSWLERGEWRLIRVALSDRALEE